MKVFPRKTNLRLLFRRPGVLARTYWLPLFVLAAGGLADGITTYRSLQLFGPGIEMHLAQQLLSEWVGVGLGVPLAKLIQVTGAVLVAMWWRPWTPWLLALCGLLYGLAALSNHFMWF